jgi:hypothetical protein
LHKKKEIIKVILICRVIEKKSCTKDTKQNKLLLGISFLDTLGGPTVANGLWGRVAICWQQPWYRATTVLCFCSCSCVNEEGRRRSAVHQLQTLNQGLLHVIYLIIQIIAAESNFPDRCAVRRISSWNF